MENLNLLAFKARNLEISNEFYQSLDESKKFETYLMAKFINDSILFANDSTLVEDLFDLWDVYFSKIHQNPSIGNQLELEKERFNNLLIDDPENVLISSYFKVYFFISLVERNKLNTHYSADESKE
ncbi:hypothetical protein [Candidatus Enterococcus mansonii]|uniref:Uncharacterized protein n=1 Tax=Candidatus Enterococcus mansonii TaxID=1834181 RepID=A0A242CFC5_9ENTE|nr:hypothetical protein [Enterococcus sp. 4G2_DIV0659]OTO08818.1 hypothetical protein A5880_001818 [Enterococcus sp. 4G2_DIV0659]